MQPSSCLASIDCCRGFAVLAMVLASYLFGTEYLPDWLRHAPDDKLTFPDPETSWHIFTADVKLLILPGGAT